MIVVNMLVGIMPLLKLVGSWVFITLMVKRLWLRKVNEIKLTDMYLSIFNPSLKEGFLIKNLFFKLFTYIYSNKKKQY
jgi:hypothetical protein